MKNCHAPLFALLMSVFSTAAGAEIVFPDGYRYWVHVSSKIFNQGHPLHNTMGGIHHLYGNKAAMKGYRSGNKFKDGSVIVFDLFEAIDKDNTLSEGVRKAIVVMEKNEAKYVSTGGWGFEVFDPGTLKGTLDNKASAGCCNCHQSQKEGGYVFSKLRD